MSSSSFSDLEFSSSQTSGSCTESSESMDSDSDSPSSSTSDIFTESDGGSASIDTDSKCTEEDKSTEPTIDNAQFAAASEPLYGGAVITTVLMANLLIFNFALKHGLSTKALTELFTFDNSFATCW